VENLFVCTGFSVVNFQIMKFYRMKKAASLEHVGSKLYQILHISDENTENMEKITLTSLSKIWLSLNLF
jgi:hypothetical protein